MEFQNLLAMGKATHADTTLPEGAVGQKKAGNCKSQEGACIIKSSRALLQKRYTDTVRQTRLGSSRTVEQRVANHSASHRVS
jgi:hypothetical protein